MRAIGLSTSTSLLPLEPTCTQVNSTRFSRNLHVPHRLLQFLYWSAVLEAMKRYLHVLTHFEVREEALILNLHLACNALPIHPSTRKVNVYHMFAPALCRRVYCTNVRHNILCRLLPKQKPLYTGQKHRLLNTSSVSSWGSGTYSQSKRLVPSLLKYVFSFRGVYI